MTNPADAADNMLSHNNALEGDILTLCDDLFGKSGELRGL